MPCSIDRPSACFRPLGAALCAALAMGSVGVAAQGLEPTAAVPEGSSAAHAMAAHERAVARPGNSVDAAFTRADTDGDNRLSREEAQRLPAVVDRFDEIDANRDRFLTREEFRRGVAN